MRKQKAQSTLEYVIVLTAVVAGIIVATALWTKHDNSSGLGLILQKSGDNMNTKSQDIKNMVK